MTEPFGNRPDSRENDSESCIVVLPHLKTGERDGREPAARLKEAVGLSRAINLRVVHSEVVGVSRRSPANLFGKGTVERLARLIAGGTSAPSKDLGAGKGEGPGRFAVVVVDAALTPVQQRNLERAWNCKVLDRTGLILEIFGARARSREGRLQVELAALTYQRSRLVRSWTHLERQRGGAGFMGGPGETQIESDRRQIGQRIARLRNELKDVKRTRHLHRRARRRVPYPIIALVGYTNAGKSTLFNALTRADVMVKDQLFATLDPTMRGLDLPSGRAVILSDTVGFVSDLPHELVTAFQATLEEVCEADLIVHVRDIAHPDTESQKKGVDRVLREMGLAEKVENSLIEVLNKIDLLTLEAREILENRVERSSSTLVPLSALTGDGCQALLAVLARRIAESFQLLDVSISLEDGASLAWLYGHGEVVERRDDEHFAHLKVRLDAANAARLARRLEKPSP